MSQVVFSKRVRARDGVSSRARRMAWSIVIPAVLFYAAFRYYPVFQTLHLSLTDAQLLRPDYQYIGLQNFATLFGDPLFRKVLWNSTFYALVTTAATTALALVLAFVFEPIGRGAGLLRMIYYLPTITSAIAIAIIWQWLYQPRVGLFNQLRDLFGLAPINWLTTPTWAMPSVIIMSVWAGVGFSTVIIIAGLQGIPVEYTDAATIDGASPLQLVLYIKLPLLAPVISFVLITGVIGSFQVFQQIYLMTRGGPLDSTRVIALEIYQTAFRDLRIGEAAAMSFVMFVVVGLLTLLQLRWQRTEGV